MKREQRTNSAEDVLANVGDSLREWAPPIDEERGALDRVWTGLRWKANQVPAEVVRSVELGPQPSRWNRRSTVWATAAAAAVLWLAISGVVGPRWLSPDRDTAVTVETADGTLYRLSGSDRYVVSAGDRLSINERLQTNGGAGAQLILTDGSRVEMRAHSETDRWSCL